MKKNLTSAGLGALLVVISQFSMVEAATPLPGAIFTTIVDGTIVNANTQYTSKCDVYLNGGPGIHAPAGAAGLPEGDYFFQVTDPSGATLLSTDVVNNRRFHIAAEGVITAYTGIGGPAHPTGISQAHPELGTITVSLANTTCPTDYLDTPNNGGVYKAWVTPVASFVGDPTKVDNPCGNGCSHGFVSSTSKTDNFKVKPTIPVFTLSVLTQIVDQSGNVIGPAPSVMITVTDSGVTNYTGYTDTNGMLSVGGLVAGTYTVTETVTGGATVVYSVTWTAGQPAPSVVFNQVAAPPPQ